MGYLVKEIFYTLQGEGTRTGRPAVLCRFAGCNLWTGREAHRSFAVCRFCDTDFVGTDGPGGGRFRSAEELAAGVAAAWQGASHPDAHPYVVCTGGEPLLQLDSEAVAALHRSGFEVAAETNGTVPAPDGLDWVCVSPKAGTRLALDRADECKLVFPQPGAPPEMFEGRGLGRLLLQPMDGADREANTAAAVRYCMDHPQWSLSLQTHKYLGIP
jgi:7-carboxy-7-deazaguanine synthase (Cx14CxxC type)